MDGHISEKSSEHMADMLKTMKMLRTKVFEQDTIIRKYGEPFDGDKMEVETSSSSSASAMGITDTKDSILSSTSSSGSMVSPMSSRLEVRYYWWAKYTFFLPYKGVVNIARLKYLNKSIL